MSHSASTTGKLLPLHIADPNSQHHVESPKHHQKSRASLVWHPNQIIINKHVLFILDCTLRGYFHPNTWCSLPGFLRNLAMLGIKPRPHTCNA